MATFESTNNNISKNSEDIHNDFIKEIHKNFPYLTIFCWMEDDFGPVFMGTITNPNIDVKLLQEALKNKWPNDRIGVIVSESRKRTRKASAIATTLPKLTDF